MNLTTVKMYKKQIKAIVFSHHATSVRVFGSVFRGEETDLSDVDFLIEPTSETSLMDIGAMRYKLRELLGVEVDILTPKALPDSLREKVLKESALL